jgi:hypothetical protein
MNPISSPMSRWNALWKCHPLWRSAARLCGSAPPPLFDDDDEDNAAGATTCCLSWGYADDREETAEAKSDVSPSGALTAPLTLSKISENRSMSKWTTECADRELVTLNFASKLMAVPAGGCSKTGEKNAASSRELSESL